MNEGASARRELRELEPGADALQPETEPVDQLPDGQNVTATRPEDVQSAENTKAPASNPERDRQRDNKPMALFPASESQGLRSRWESLQVNFIDEPRHAVEDADRLVSETINGLTKGFASEREKLEQQWHRGEDVSTEDLRQALRRYRSFFERLLAL
jgi:hypothetical protein